MNYHSIRQMGINWIYLSVPFSLCGSEYLIAIDQPDVSMSRIILRVENKSPSGWQRIEKQCYES